MLPLWRTWPFNCKEGQKSGVEEGKRLGRALLARRVEKVSADGIEVIAGRARGVAIDGNAFG